MSMKQLGFDNKELKEAIMYLRVSTEEQVDNYSLETQENICSREADTVTIEDSKGVRERVQRARDKQIKRYKNTPIAANAELTNKNIKEFCKLSDECMNLLRLAVSKMNLSGRSYYRVIKLARTIADLEDCEAIAPNHIAEALQYRPRVQNA